MVTVYHTAHTFVHIILVQFYHYTTVSWNHSLYYRTTEYKGLTAMNLIAEDGDCVDDQLQRASCDSALKQMFIFCESV